MCADISLFDFFIPNLRDFQLLIRTDLMVLSMVLIGLIWFYFMKDCAHHASMVLIGLIWFYFMKDCAHHAPSINMNLVSGLLLSWYGGESNKIALGTNLSLQNTMNVAMWGNCFAFLRQIYIKLLIISAMIMRIFWHSWICYINFRRTTYAQTFQRF